MTDYLLKNKFKIPSAKNPHIGKKTVLVLLLSCSFVLLIYQFQILNQDVKTTEIVLDTNTRQSIFIHSSIDDTNLRDPNGMDQGRITGYFNRKIVIENISQYPIHNPYLVINNRDFSQYKPLAKYLRLKSNHLKSILSLYQFWKEIKYHGTSFMPENTNPFLAVNYWGYTFCGDDFFCLRKIFAHMGIQSRQEIVNGHVIGEYYFLDKWNVIDGDRRCIYLNLDNQTLASFDDIRNDPFIALRTKPFGKYERYQAETAWQNTSVFEFINPEKKPSCSIEQLKKTINLHDMKWTLYPGEKIIYHHTQSPEHALGKGSKTWRKKYARSLGLIEFVINPGIRKDRKVSTKYPIIKVLAHDSKTINYPPEDQVCNTVVTPESKEAVRIFCQGTQTNFPSLSRGDNHIVLHSDTPKGQARICFYHQSGTQSFELPQVSVKKAYYCFSSQVPFFDIQTDNDAELMWWQISPYVDFSFILPNFEQIQPLKPKVRLKQIDTSFLNNKTTYYFRIRIKDDGIWGKWSNITQFQVKKPDRPVKVSYQFLPDHSIRLKWSGSDKYVYLVFASNRLDFIPQIYSTHVVTEIYNNKVVGKQKNDNLILKTTKQSCIIGDPMAFYRIIAKKGDLCSTPSDLIKPYSQKVPDNARIPPATVLQTRWHTVEDSSAETGYRDIYHAKEMRLTHDACHLEKRAK